LLLLIELASRDAGLPPGVVNVVTGTGTEVGTPLVQHPLVRKVSFTGSVRAAQEIGHIAADRILPLGLELGGKSPHLVFADADRARALDGVIAGLVTNAGQLCSAGSRCLVDRSILRPFVKDLRQRIDALTIGPAADDTIGPVITPAQHAKVRSHYEAAALEHGDRFYRAPLADGLRDRFIPPAFVVLDDRNAGILKEEVFGPLLAILPFDSESEAIDLANDSDYGLVACIWTKDLSRAHRLAARLQVGQVFVNEYFAGGVETTFGGFKQSGYGREKGIEALRQYTHLKAVTVRL